MHPFDAIYRHFLRSDWKILKATAMVESSEKWTALGDSELATCILQQHPTFMRQWLELEEHVAIEDLRWSTWHQCQAFQTFWEKCPIDNFTGVSLVDEKLLKYHYGVEGARTRNARAQQVQEKTAPQFWRLLDPD